MCGTKEILLKSWKKPHNLSPILAPTPGTPGNPGKNLTICGPSPGPPEILEKPHNLRTITGTPEILEKNLTILRICLLLLLLLLVVPTSCAEAPCGGND